MQTTLLLNGPDEGHYNKILLYLIGYLYLDIFFLKLCAFAEGFGILSVETFCELQLL